MKPVLAIDPGLDKADGTPGTALVNWDGTRIIRAELLTHQSVLEDARIVSFDSRTVVAIEMIACYGMAVGREVFETCLLIGRLLEAFTLRGYRVDLIYRRDVKLHHCMSPRAKDSNVRQALIDKYGAPGTKNSPGLTYGLKSHLWAAFAIATYCTETNKCQA